MRTVFKLIFLITTLVGIAPRVFGQISIINLGTSRSAFGNAFGVRQNIVASNASNSVALVHRHTTPGASGTIKADVSIDGGNTWVVNKIETWNGASANSSARYPRAALINPTGNTNGSNAVLVSAQPVLDGSNGSWGGLGLAGFTLDGTTLGNQSYSSSPTRDTMHQTIKSVVSAGNKVFILDKNGDLNATDFSDTLLLTIGTYNGSSFQWNRQFINFPVGSGSNGKTGISDITMAFDPSGQIGYIVALTHIDFVSDTASNYLPVLMKTTDGGNTWSSPVQLNISPAVNNVFNLGTSIVVGTGFEVSATVDYLGNCHWVTHVGEVSGAYTVVSAPGKSGTFHFSSNGSTLLSCTKIGTPGSLRGTFGTGSSTLSQDTRPCASRNEAGTALFFSWFETDINNSSANDQPDLWSVGYTVSTQLHTPGRNITKNTLAEGAMVFGSVAPIVFERIGTNGKPEFELPVSFVELNATGDINDSTYHRYLKGAVISMTNNSTLVISSSGKTSICDGVPVTLSTSSTSSKQWYRNGQILTGDTSQSYLATVAGSYFLVSNGDTSNTISLTTGTKPMLNLPDTFRIASGSAILNPGTAQSYSWSTGSNNAAITVTNTGRYSVTGYNGGCTTSVSTYVIFVNNPNPLPSNSISVINLGTSRNAFGNAFGVRQNIVASNASNSVAMVHRHTLPGSSGTVKADVSIDGGNTWVVKKMETWTGATSTSAARYPRAALINPTGNTNGSNAVLVSVQPVLDGTNGSFGGLGIAGFTLDGTSLGNQSYSSSQTLDTMHQTIKSVISAGNKVFILDKNGSLSATDFSDTLLLTTGTFNGSSFQWSRTLLPFPTGTSSNGKAGISDMTMAFDPTGQIGYIVALTHIDFVSDTASNYLPVLMKTTDGGNTWSSPVQLNISPAVNNVFNLGTSIVVGTGFEVSATVDYLGNCHWVTHVGEVGGAYSVVSAPGKSGTFHFSSNGSTLLSCTQIGAPASLRGTYGINSSTLYQDTRPCASRNEAGTALFFSWFETDTLISTSNNQPDIFSVGYNVKSQGHTIGYNLTKNSLAAGKMIFGSVAPIVFERIGANGFIDFELPVSFVALNASGDVNDSCYHRYLKGAVISLATTKFSISSNGVAAICDSAPVILNSNSTGNFNWFRNGILIPGVTGSSYVATLPGAYYAVNGDTSNTIVLTYATKPIISLPDTLRSSSNLSVLLSPGAAQTYQWSTGDTSSTLIVTNAGQYRVVASNALGCSSSDTCVVIFNQSAPSPLPTQTAALNYQASLTNSQGQPLANSTVGVRFSVYDSTSISFSETQTVTTDARGHFSTRIGQGTALVGSLGAISWWDGKPRNLKTEVDLNNSGNWTNLGNSPLVMVPYSMYSLRSDDGRRSIFGSINASGNIISGRGFTVTNLGNNQFEINFLQPFSEIPNVILEPVGSSPSLNLLSRNLHKFVVQFTGSELQFEVKGF